MDLRIAYIGVATVAIALPGVASAQLFHGEEAERVVQFEWVSNSIQQFGSDLVRTYDVTGPFNEAISDFANAGDDYILTINAAQDSLIDDRGLIAVGSSSFSFEAGEFAQGAHADLSASSTFFYWFQVSDPGPFDLAASLVAVDGWGAQLALVNDTTGEELLVLDGTSEVDTQVMLDNTSFYVFKVTTFGSFFIDDRNAFEVRFEGSGSYDASLIPAPALNVSGACPGTSTLTASRMSPGGDVAFVYGFATGSTIVPSGPCAGIELGLARNVQLAAITAADTNGVARLTRNIPAAACGTVFVQALDLATCRTTNVLGL